MTILSNLSKFDIFSQKRTQTAILFLGCVMAGSLLPHIALAKESSEPPALISAVPIRQRTPASDISTVQINSFGFDDLPDFSGPGCRLLLATDGTEEGGEEIVFVTLGADDTEGVFMRINGEFVRFYPVGEPTEIDHAVYLKPYESQNEVYYLSALLDYSDYDGEYTYMAYGNLAVSTVNQQTTTVSAAGMTCH